MLFQADVAADLVDTPSTYLIRVGRRDNGAAKLNK
jgi:hypothetical protein